MLPRINMSLVFIILVIIGILVQAGILRSSRRATHDHRPQSRDRQGAGSRVDQIKIKGDPLPSMELREKTLLNIS
jgi:hypothetical protein